MYRLLLAILAVFMVLGVCACAAMASVNPIVFNDTEPETRATLCETAEAKPLNNNPLLYSELTYSELYDIESCTDFVNELQQSIKAISDAISSNEYTIYAVDEMVLETIRLKAVITAVESDIERYTAWEQEHYYAAKTWEFFKKNGFSDVVTSAIIGNMMIETSGGTLNLKPAVYSSGGGFYGLCQWSLYYRPHVADMSFEDQLVYLYDDLEYEFNTFGFCYKRGFTYEDFLAMEDPAKAALSFAKVYERCGEGSYGARERAAVVAYEYFTDEI